MKNKSIQTLALFSLISFMACSQNSATPEIEEVEKQPSETEKSKVEPHRYGGWYCPDNLNGFPAVNISQWQEVPVINGRLPKKEEAQNGSSLIFVDTKKFPNAKPLDMVMPQLAHYKNYSSGKDELVIVIQAIEVQSDSVVGFRYLNGGNGSARINEVSFLSDKEITSLPASQFVSFTLEINASQKEIWEVIANSSNSEKLQPIFDAKNALAKNWRESSKINFHYADAGEVTGAFAGEMYGNYYAQIDSKRENGNYVEKFLLTDNAVTHLTSLQIVCGPYFEDYNEQKEILNKWAKKVKELSEK